ncbi:NADH-quinone oxidoreductase subunit D [bacterium]|nr:NADH-quinone oxidoreductase subunit D [bacterium]
MATDGRECIDTEEMYLSMGPQHPSTHGVIRFILRTDSEIVQECRPDVGYLHRGIEKLAEGLTYQQFLPYTDRLDYLAALNYNLGWCLTVERLGGLEVARRSEYLRVITAELTRIASHLIALGSLSLDMGASTPFTYCIREREFINDLFEELCGNRLLYNYVRIGGVSQDLPVRWDQRCLKFLDYFAPRVDEFNDLISYQKIFIHRLIDVGVISAETAISYGLVGPNLRGSGVDWDLRRDEPYSIYPELDFKVCVPRGLRGTMGDCYHRYWVRIWEMGESAKIIRQCLAGLPEGEIISRVPKSLKLPKGELYLRTEAPRGELGFHLVSDGGKTPYRVKVRNGSFSSLAIMNEVVRGLMIPDVVAVFGSFDVVAPEVDR